MVALWERWFAWLCTFVGWRPDFGQGWVEPSNEITRSVYAALAGEEGLSAAAEARPPDEHLAESPVVAQARATDANTRPVDAQAAATEPPARAVPGRAA
ncbi:MAG: hypothetical protein IT304_02125 [Dehalococcoidia bacterium]|nr:hypothetical protein [Dehalococcoidia bacterium]